MREVEVVGVRVEMPTNQPLLADPGQVLHQRAAVLGSEVTDPLADALGDELEEVRIVDVRDGVFFASLIFASGAEVEARPSDSIALALRSGARIVCTEDVLDEAGIQSTREEDEEVERFREFLEEVAPDDFG